MSRRRRICPTYTLLNHLTIHAVLATRAPKELVIVNRALDLYRGIRRNKQRITRNEVHLLAPNLECNHSSHAVYKLMVLARPARNGRVCIRLAHADLCNGKVAVCLDRGRERREDGPAGLVPVMRTCAIGEEVWGRRVIRQSRVALVPVCFTCTDIILRHVHSIDIVCLCNFRKCFARECDALVWWEGNIICWGPWRADIREELIETGGLDEAKELGFLSHELVRVVGVARDHGKIASS